MHRLLKTIFHSVLMIAAVLLFHHASAAPVPQPSVKFVVFSPPKCGTHLIGKLLGLMYDLEPEYHLNSMGSLEQSINTCEEAINNGRFVVAHDFDKDSLSALVKKGYKILFTLRDPRDHLVSVLDWIREGQWDWHAVSKMQNESDQIYELITGKKYGWQCYDSCIGSRLAVASKFPPTKCYITRFEYLVGAEGGGDSKIQLQEILNIASFLGDNIPYDHAQYVADQVYGGTRTFRKGQIGTWKERLNDDQKFTFKRLYGRTLIKLGYEKSMSW